MVWAAWRVSGGTERPKAGQVGVHPLRWRPVQLGERPVEAGFDLSRRQGPRLLRPQQAARTPPAGVGTAEYQGADQLPVAAVDVDRQPRAERVPSEVDRPCPERADEDGDRIGVVGKARIRCRVGGATAAGRIPGDDVVLTGQGLQLGAQERRSLKPPCSSTSGAPPPRGGRQRPRWASRPGAFPRSPLRKGTTPETPTSATAPQATCLTARECHLLGRSQAPRPWDSGAGRRTDKNSAAHVPVRCCERAACWWYRLVAT